MTAALFADPDHLVPLVAPAFDVCAIFLVDLKAQTRCAKAHLSYLSICELERYEGLKSRPVSAQQFLAGRGSLRCILAAIVGRHPSEFSIRPGMFGKPETPDSDLFFNLSHSAGMAAIVVSRREPVGVDIECYRHIKFLETVCRRFFTSAEFDWVLAAPVETRNVRFIRMWSAKEAFIKATGFGLRQNLKSFSIEMDDSTQGQPTVSDELSRGWSIHHFAVAGPTGSSRYFGSAAAQAADRQFRVYSPQLSLLSHFVWGD